MNPPQWLNVRIARRSDLASNIALFELEDVQGHDLPAFEAGAHIDVRVAEGLVRQYSICNAPSERHRYVIAVLQVENSRGGSVGVHRRFQDGQTIQVSHPRNHFPLSEHGKRSILLAGGIGVTPILSMARQLWAEGRDFDMHYCVRSASAAAFSEELAQSPFAHRVAVHVDDDATQKKFELAEVLANPDADTHLYVCGPGGFMDAVLRSAQHAGWHDSTLHKEFFAPPQDSTSTHATAFDVKIASSGRVVRVEPHETVVRALERSSILIRVSCEQGICGTCLTDVLEGIPEHRDVYLSEEEKRDNKQFLPCCSRSRSPLLVLDL